MQKGNLWQYRYRTSFGGGGWLVNMVSYGDTMMPNGLKYNKLITAPYEPRSKYCRIDSSYRIQEYYSFIGDTCGGLYNEMNIFRLNEPDSSSWRICYNIGENLFPPILRYLGVLQYEAFSDIRDIKLFRQYHKFYDAPSGDTIKQYGATYILMKGVGVYYTEWGESSSATLEGAIIDGVQYGNVVGVVEHNEGTPNNFSLYQNYPNPFNGETIISFTLPVRQSVKLEIYNAIGQLITSLENNVLSSGIHVRSFRNNYIPSGVYYVRLHAGNRIATKKMMYIK